MFILKGVKVVCFVIVLQVFILKVLSEGLERAEKVKDFAERRGVRTEEKGRDGAEQRVGRVVFTGHDTKI